MKTHQDILDAMEAARDKCSAERSAADNALQQQIKAIQVQCKEIGHIFKRGDSFFNIGKGPAPRQCILCWGHEAV